jgi:hypothetical protein
MQNDSRVRLCGVLASSHDDYVLRTEDGNVWRFKRTLDADLLEGRRVTLEGTRIGLDRLCVEWMGEPPPVF